MCAQIIRSPLTGEGHIFSNGSADNNHEPPTKDRTVKTLAEKVRPIQERARQEDFVSDGSSDKPMMDETWGEESTE
jgi:hypothetical protein